jgi:hypothetical protein
VVVRLLAEAIILKMASIARAAVRRMAVAALPALNRVALPAIRQQAVLTLTRSFAAPAATSAAQVQVRVCITWRCCVLHAVSSRWRAWWR